MHRTPANRRGQDPEHRIRPCFQFQAGKCRYGPRCKFSHEQGISSSSTDQTRPRNSTKSRQDEQKQDGLREWKRILVRTPDRNSCSRFFKLAHDLMSGDPGAAQEVIKQFAQDDGLSYVRYLIERQIPEAVAQEARRDIWTTEVHPLLEFITHPTVVDSAVFEAEVATIYNFIQGIGGRRMKSLFDFAMDLPDVAAPPPAPDNNTILTILDLSIRTLAKMIDCNTSNIINENFKIVFERLGGLLANVNSSTDDFLKFRAQKYQQRIRTRLDVGDSILSQSKHTTSMTTANFTMQRDMPGMLSPEGPRHDNDHAEIADIRILPTHEEIVSPRSEYLPTSDSTCFHLPGIRGRLDREFRLLREDTVGQLRDAVHAQLNAMQTRDNSQRDRKKNGLRTFVYEDASVENVLFDKHQGMRFVVRVRQPAPMRELRRRRDWWAHSKRLKVGGLVCVISDKGSVIFCVVADETVITSTHDGGQRGSPPEEEGKARKLSLADDESFAYVHLQIAEVERESISQALRWYRDAGAFKRWCVVEFPGVLLPSFQHTLKALQRMSRQLNVPFTNLIAPSQDDQNTNIGPSLYASKRGFCFDLSCLTNDSTALLHSSREPLEPQELANRTTMDITQSSALLDALISCLALIQGPPGTGKSYTGEKLVKVLLANKKAASLGPILCVCYTNHALDQLLEHLLDADIKQIVRIGSRSKSERLEDVNLRVVARQAARTKAEKRALWESENALEQQAIIITNSLRELSSCHSNRAIERYLENTYPQHYSALLGVDEDGFKTVRHSKQSLKDWLHSGDRANSSNCRPVEELLKASLWEMTHAERTRLHSYWVRDIREPILREIVREYTSYTRSKQNRDKAMREVDLRCLSEADIIGVTTTGLARNMDLLQKLRCKVMLCEEAGEVLEAHTVTALLPSVEHAILIGDHLQLQPQTQNYDLQRSNPHGARYSFDMSLFERLVNPPHAHEPRLPYRTLDTQRRMHPSIANLIRQTLYPSLEDGGLVSGYPAISGIKRRLFWLHHENLEDRATQLDPTTTSHTNSFEADMTVSLVQHLVRQGLYAAEDIAVITPYLGQLFMLRQRMSNLFEISIGDRDEEGLEALEVEMQTAGIRPPPKKASLLQSIRLATVDNFQGEEAKVVIVSLVRSNSEGRCGFLRTSNRINVLLSRAQHGMYLLGNSKTYGHVEMWSQIIKLLEQDGNIGPELELQCVRHPNTPICVSHPDHFLQFSPEGGCNVPCGRRLACGHSCDKRCHSEVIHNAVECHEPCPRPKTGCSHSCRLRCGQACEPKCTEVVENIALSLRCGHTVYSALCWQFQEPDSIRCTRKVQKVVPGCNHVVEVPCHVDVTSNDYMCRHTCGKPQSCGHSCKSPCHKCIRRSGGETTSENHGICKQPCGRKYTTCPHSCIAECHGEAPCMPCGAPCEVTCSHSTCSKLCHEPCAPCAEQACASRCPHTQCTMPCAAPCDWVPCPMRCKQRLSCGHQCPSVCGEKCPDVDFCQTCCSQHTKSIVVDYLEGLQYHEIDLDTDPCIFPQCGHIMTKQNLDGLMDMKAHYKMSSEENPVSILGNSQPFSMDEVKTCPTCRGSLRSVARYGRLVRRAMLDEATKKFISWSHTESLKLAGRLAKTQQELSEMPQPRPLPQNTRPSKAVFSKGRLKQLHMMRDWVGTGRYDKAISLWNAINNFSSKVRKEEQPFKRVSDFVQHAARQRRAQSQFVLDESLIQAKGHLQASALLLKCDTVIFSDFVDVYKTLVRVRPDLAIDFTQHLQDCDSLVQLARIKNYPREEVEGHIHFAKFCAFARRFGNQPNVSNGIKLSADDLKTRGSEHLNSARNLLVQYRSTKSLEPEIEAADRMLSSGVFYQQVSTDELRTIYEAMSREFLGTGHWYNCANGHPFTVGECGMPMEEARCPECEAPVGGMSHVPAQGVQRADNIEDIAHEFGRMAV